MKRRAYLKDLKTIGGFAAFSAATTTSAAAYDSLSSGFNEPAVPRKYIKDEGLQKELDSIYSQGFPGFEEGGPNVLFDVIPVGDQHLQDSIARRVEKEHDRNGINAIVREREQSFPEDDFLDRYGWTDNSILGYRGEGFVDEQVPDILRDIAVPVVMSPGYPDDPRGWIYNDGQGVESNQWLLGSSTDSIAFAADSAFQDEYLSRYLDGKLRLVMHEIGHIYGLDHSESENDLMHPEIRLDMDPGFSSGEWRRIRESLEY